MSLLLGRGDPLRTKAPYGILGEALRQRFELRLGQDPTEQRARLYERIAATLPAVDALRSLPATRDTE